MQDNEHRLPPDGPGEYRFWVRLHMPPDGWTTFRAEHTLSVSEPTRDRLATVLHVELEGLGENTTWWDRVDVT